MNKLTQSLTPCGLCANLMVFSQQNPTIIDSNKMVICSKCFQSRPILFVSGHLSLTNDEFEEHYLSDLNAEIHQGSNFIVGDADGADKLTQSHLFESGVGKNRVLVFHMFHAPRFNVGMWNTIGGFNSDDERDTALTQVSDKDIAWVRAGRESSGTQMNINRREQIEKSFDDLEIRKKVSDAGDRRNWDY